MQLPGLLSRSDVFQGLSEPYLGLIASFAKVRQFEVDEFIFREGGAADYLYLIVSGQASFWMRVSCPSRHSTENISLSSVTPLHSIGLAAVIPPHVYPFSARAVSPIACIPVHGASLRSHMEADHEFGYFVYRNL